MNCSNESAESDKNVVCWSTYHKKCYAANRERILARQKWWRTENSEVLRACCKRWYENNKEWIVRNQGAYCQQNKEHINSYRRKYGKDNRERQTNIGEVIMPKLINGSSEDFGTKSKQTQTRISCGLRSGTNGQRNWKEV